MKLEYLIIAVLTIIGFLSFVFAYNASLSTHTKNFPCEAVFGPDYHEETTVYGNAWCENSQGIKHTI